MKRLTIAVIIMIIFAMTACKDNPTPSGESTTPTDEGTTPDTTKEDKVSEIKRIVIKLCGNEEYPCYVENSLGKAKKSEIVSMKQIIENIKMLNEIGGMSYNEDEFGEANINNSLFKNKIWNEVTQLSEKTETIIKAMESGYIRVYNDNGEEFVLLKSTNGAIYKEGDSVRYFLWFEADGSPASADDFCDMWYDEMAGGKHALANIVIDDSTGKTSEELAYEIMEKYRVFSSTLLPDNIYYFDELKLISLEVREISDSDAKLHGEVKPADILKFRVQYAVNAADSDRLAGGWVPGEGEYEGYMINGYTVTAVRHDGKWYCVSMSNG